MVATPITATPILTEIKIINSNGIPPVLLRGRGHLINGKLSWLPAEPVILYGISPENAGDIIFEAIKNNTFYILTDMDLFWKNMIKERMNGIFHAFNKS